jgi:hypothetical protein
VSDAGNQVTRIWQGLIAHDGSVELDVSGHHARGNAQEVANWIGYGEDVLAVADAALLAGEGLPFAIARHEALGDYPDLDDFDAGKPWRALPAQAVRDRRGEMPAPGAVVEFPEN